MSSFTRAYPVLAAALLSGCSSAPPPVADGPLLLEIRNIRAIDNHAHPVRFTAEGEAPDREFDALPVDSMEPQSDPVKLRNTEPATVDAWHALYPYPFGDFSPEHLRQGQAGKSRLMREHGDGWPTWMLDRLGIDIMLANRVAMGTSIQPPRFRWVPYADALLFPLDNGALAARNSDRKSFFALEDRLRARYLAESGAARLPASLDEYLTRVVTATLERHRQGGAVAEKFEAAYLRGLDFDPVERKTAAAIYHRYVRGGAPDPAAYKPLQDFLFRYIAGECGRLGMAVHLHTMAGAGGYFDVAGANPLALESVLDDPQLRRTRFVMVHGGWPFTREITALLTKPNVYLDFSAQDLLLAPATLAATLRQWLEYVPEKVMFGSDAYPFSPELGWEESGWVAARNGRQALAIALTTMMREDGISRARASELARMAMRQNARALYAF